MVDASGSSAHNHRSTLYATIPKSLPKNLEALKAEMAHGLMQKSVVLETAHIIRRVMDSLGGRLRPGIPHYEQTFQVAVAC